MNAEQIRAQYVEVLALEVASWEGHGEPLGRHKWYAGKLGDALAAAGLLPVETQRLAAYAALDTSDEHLVQRYLTEWRAVAK